MEAGSIPTGTLRGLDLAGDLAHIAVLLILVTVLVCARFSYVSQLPHALAALRPQPAAAGRPVDLFILSSIEFLSNILFALTLLEVRHTTVIFLHDRSSRAIVRAFRSSPSSPSCGRCCWSGPSRP